MTGQAELPGLRRVPPAVRAALEDERLARAAWSRLAEPGDGAAAALVAEVGAALALEAVVTGRGPARWRSRLEQVDPVGDLAVLRAVGGRLLVPGDDEWPEPLGDLSRAVGADVRPVTTPFCLWVRGPADLRQVAGHSVSIVGTRHPTPYGETVAAEFSVGLADRGLAVVSGGAVGIDAVAHRAAVAVDGTSVAVLACGVDRVYPVTNAPLQTRLARTGALVSEFPPGTAPTRWRFLDRNRIIAALGRATVVVEAAWRSGALSTAERAERIGRPVGAVPGPVASTVSAGCHRLLRDRGAVCVTTPDDVVELVSPVGQVVPTVPATPVRRFDGLEPEELRIAECLPRRGSAELEDLAREAGVDLGAAHGVLGRLELAGIAVRKGTGFRLGVTT